jgi:hypothetical protein
VVFFAVALAPGGNVAASLRSWARKSGAGFPCLEQGLPVAIYLGYFTGGGENRLAETFEALSPSLLGSLPPSIHLDHLVQESSGCFLAAREDLGPAIAKAGSLAVELGLEPLRESPLSSGPGYFAGKLVTTAEAESFSFRHLDALLVRVELSDGPSGALVWTIVRRVRRLVGSGGRSAADGTS